MAEYQINDQIKAQSVLLINAEGVKVGIVSLKRALHEAEDVNLDLVCMNPNSNPVVCKIFDYSKFQYQAKKREKENKANQQKVETKEIQLRPQIAQHDVDVRLKKCREELAKGNKIKFVISFKGRQMAFTELGFKLLNGILADLDDVCTVSKPGTLDGRRIECIIVPKK